MYKILSKEHNCSWTISQLVCIEVIPIYCCNWTFSSMPLYFGENICGLILEVKFLDHKIYTFKINSNCHPKRRNVPYQYFMRISTSPHNCWQAITKLETFGELTRENGFFIVARIGTLLLVRLNIFIYVYKPFVFSLSCFCLFFVFFIDFVLVLLICSSCLCFWTLILYRLYICVTNILFQ